MILDHLDQAERYAGLNPGLPAAFAFLSRPDLAQLAPGRYPIDGDRVYALVQRPTGRPREGAQAEAHRAYIDVQYVIDGTPDVMGWRPLAGCREVVRPYDAEGDAMLFADAAEAWVEVPPEHFVVFFPADAHIPNVASGALHKVVVKVRCEG